VILGRRHVLASPSHRLLLHPFALAVLTVRSLAGWYRIVSDPDAHWDFRLAYWRRGRWPTMCAP